MLTPDKLDQIGYGPSLAPASIASACFASVPISTSDAPAGSGSTGSVFTFASSTESTGSTSSL